MLNTKICLIHSPTFPTVRMAWAAGLGRAEARPAHALAAAGLPVSAAPVVAVVREVREEPRPRRRTEDLAETCDAVKLGTRPPSTKPIERD